MLKTNHYTTEAEGWRPYFKENDGYKGLPLHDVLEKSGLDFRAIKRPTYYDWMNVKYPSNRYSVIREDTGMELGGGFAGDTDSNGQLTDKGYHVIQHEDALRQIFHDVLDLEKDAYCVNAIGFDNGARVAISFRLPGELQIKPGDKLGLYLNFFNAFDGSDGAGWSWFFLRPVCQNTYRRARTKGENGYFTKHTKNIAERLMFNASEILGLAHIQANTISQEFIKWANIPASDNTIKEFLNAMHPDKIIKATDNKSVAQKINQGPSNRREELYNVISNGELVDPNNPTIWDLFNGVTKIATWKRTDGRKDDASQMEYAQEGTGAKYSNDAFNWLKGYVG